MNKDITVREYNKGDEISILKLRGLVLGPRDMDWWVWKFKRKPGGQSIIVIAEDKDKKEIVGHFSYLLHRIKIKDVACLVVMSVDNMVHPEYRGLGIYKQLREKIHETARQNNILWTYSFPNEITSRIGFRIPFSETIFKKAPLWIKPIKVKNIIMKYFKKNNVIVSLLTLFIKGIARISDRSRNYRIHTEVREVKEIDERFDSLWGEAASMYKIMMVRDKAFLDWRYVRKPDASYTIYVSEVGNKLLGYIVLRSVEDNGLKSGWIVDMLTCTKDTPASMDLIRKAIQHFETMGVDMVSCTMPPRTHIASSLRKNGFSYSYRWLRRLNPIRIAPIPPGQSEKFLYNPNNWYLTKGDSDTV